MEVQASVKVEKSSAEADRGPIHEHKFARNADGPLLFQGLMHLKGLLAAILAGRYAVCDSAHPVVEQRPVDETGPDIQNFGKLLGQTMETPALVGVECAGEVFVKEALIKIDHAGDESRLENADAAVIQQIYARRLALVFENRIVAKMGIAMDHAELAERDPPGLEHGGGDPSARGLACAGEAEKLASFEPLHCQQARRRQVRPHLRNANVIEIGQNS